ncbi:MAG: hypothetical protein U1F41_06560 [Burkholderiales bacterium]
MQSIDSLSRPYPWLVGVWLVSMSPDTALAYERATHRRISEATVAASYLGEEEQRKRLGFRHPIDDKVYPGQELYPSSKGERMSPYALIRGGSDWEDDVPPGPTTHFFDPRNGRGLEFVPAQYAGDGTDSLGTSTLVAISTMNALSVPSPRWVVAGTGATNVLPGWPTSNDYSIPNAREHLYRGLTDPNPLYRKTSMGRMFESLGRIVHHIQDMAQPQHVRNDGHLSDPDVDGVCGNPIGAAAANLLGFCTAYKRLRRESVYESWTDRADVRPGLPVQGYAPVFPGTPAPAGRLDGVGVFTTPLRFWQHEGKGIAEYASRNFLTQGTLDVAPPQTGAPYDVPLESLCGTSVPPCELRGPLPVGASVRFFPSTVDDQFRGGSAVHPYAKTYSIFNPDLKGYAGREMYAVNRFTFAVDHQYLIPRAVAYSAGLINYFFRGDMEVTPPEEGIYAIVDTSTSGCGTPCGFRWLRLKIKNVTPGAERMGKGNLVAVARFHRNKCFRPDLSGNYDVPPFERSCRNPAEEIVVSALRPVADGEIDTATARSFEFDFSANPIPIDSSDLDLQIIYRGALGEETDAIALRTVDIAEPNFLGVLNAMDYVFDVTGQAYHPLGDYGATKKKVANLGLRFKAGTSTVGSLPELDGGQFARVAFLTMTGNVEGTVLGSRGDIPFQFDVREFGLDAYDRYARACPVNEARGLYWEFLFFYPQVRDEGGIIKREGEEGPVGGRTAAVMQRNALQAKATCGWSTEGIYDMSVMTALDVAQAVPFSIEAIWKVPPK